MDNSSLERDAFGHPKDGKLRCGFCYPREQFTHGEIKREYLSEFDIFWPCCRKHAPTESLKTAN